MNEAEKNIKFKTRKPLLYISMVSMAMFFAGLTSGYIVRKGEGNWFEFDLPFYFSLSTSIILLSWSTVVFCNATAAIYVFLISFEF